MLGTHTDFSQFAIGFDPRDRARLHALWDEVIDSEQWSHGEMNRRFEEAWAAWNGAAAVACSGWTGGALAALDFAGVRGETVLCPSNTFMATPLAIHRRRRAARVRRLQPRGPVHVLRGLRAQGPSATGRAAAVLVHIGGHIAFDERADRRATAATQGIFLLEDCAHAHGASLERPQPGHVRRRRRVLVLRHQDGLDRRGRRARLARPRSCSSSRARSATTASPTTTSTGLNFRMSEFTAALGARADRAAGRDRRLEERRSRASTWTPRTRDRLELPDGMTSGLYKYIVFDPIERSTGKVYDEPCHRIMGTGDDLPNTDWVAEQPLVRPALLPPRQEVAA